MLAATLTIVALVVVVIPAYRESLATMREEEERAHETPIQRLARSARYLDSLH